MTVPTPTPDATTEPATADPDATANQSPPADTPPAAGGDTPSVEDYVNDESLDLDSSGLPEPTVKEIKKLRGDAKKWRETATGWESATSGWADEDVKMLRDALAAGPSNPDVVGQWMLDNARDLLGDRFNELVGGSAPAAPVDEDTDDEPAGPLTPEQVEKLVEDRLAAREKAAQEEAAMQAKVQEIVKTTEDLGFGPSHPLHEALLSTARHRFNGDLAKAAELLSQGAGAGQNDTTTQDAPDESGHTPVPQEGQAPAGTQRVSDPKKAAQERLAKTLGSARGFADI